MPQIRVKAKHANEVFGFNNSAKPLGQRDDLHLLIEAAKANNDQHILNMFEEVPTDQELAEIKEDLFLSQREKPKRKRKQSKSE